MGRLINKLKPVICIIFIAMLITSQLVYAEENAKIVETYVEGKNITIYVNGVSDEVKKVSCMITSNPCKSLLFNKVDNKKSNIKTLILIDSSKSITEKERNKIQDLILGLIDNKSENESFCIASYGKKIKYLSDYNKDRYELFKAYQKVTYKKQTSYLSDIVSEANGDLDDIHDNSLKRIIILSDGYDNNPYGITKEELYNELEESAYPIYTIGCVHEDNKDSLKEFFSLSRRTGAKSFQLEEKTKVEKIAKSIINTTGYLQVIIAPDREIQDGSIKTVELSIETSKNTVELKKDIRMNMIEKKSEEVKKSDQTATEKFSIEKETKKENNLFSLTNIIIMALVAVCLIALSIIIGIFIGKENSNKVKLLEKSNKTKKPDILISGGKNVSDQEFASNIGRSFKSSGDDLDRTVILRSDDGADKSMVLLPNKSLWNVKLKDINNSRIFVKELKNELIIGRMGNINDPTRIILDYETSVSKKHCRIFMKEEDICIEDMGSVNCTYLNGAVVNGQVNLSSGDVIGIGKLRLQVGLEKL